MYIFDSIAAMFKKTPQGGGGMEWDELKEARAAFIACEIGGVVIELIIDDCVINRDSIIERLESKCHSVGDATYRGVLFESIDIISGSRLSGDGLEEG
ncbi:TPA: hypothetical protein ACPUG2_004487 [Klebsiella pneumoniae]